MKLSFDPAKNGWHFPANIIAEAMGVKRSNGLCGGMSLAAVNYLRYNINIPAINSNDFKQACKMPGKNVCLPEDGNIINTVLNFIVYSQFAVFESPNMLKQKTPILFPDTKENHHFTSINDEFPKIKNALDSGYFVVLGLRSIKKDHEAPHQTLVYGYDENNYTLYMYDGNNPDEEITVKSNGYRLIFSNGKEYSSYYLLMALDPNVRSGLDTYESSKNHLYNFSVKPPAA
jgi:hypothetical protein